MSYRKLAPKKLQELYGELTTFENIDSTSLGYDALKRHHNWANTIENKLNEFDAVIEDCHRFLVRENITGINNSKRYL